MKGRKSARGFSTSPGSIQSMQSCPVKNLDVLAVQVETLREQRAKFARATAGLERAPQLDHPAPFAGIRREGSLGSRGHEVRVIPGGHGPKSSGRIDLRP